MTAASSRHALRDSLFIAAIVLLSLSPYVARLGFYSDDWYFLDRMSRAESEAITDLFRSLYEPHSRMRPAQLLYFASLRSLFGVQPRGYHLMNASVFVVMAVFFHLALRAMYMTRMLAISIALMFVLLPHYSTNRFWFSAFGHTLSMALYFTSLYALLRALKARRQLRWRLWLAASIVALATSGLCFEVPLPFFAVNAGLAWFLAPRLAEARVGLSATRIRAAIAAGATVVPLIGIAVFKWRTTVRLGSAEEHSTLTILRRAWRLNVPPEMNGLNIELALRTSFGDYGIGLPRLVLEVLADRPSTLTLVPTMVIAAAVAGYLLVVARSSEARVFERATALNQAAALVAGGFGVFWLGYAIFLTNSNLQFTTTGIGNRVNIGAAVGVAMVLIGAVHGLSALCPSTTWRVRTFGLLVATLCASGTLLNNVMGRHWIRAYDQERAILADIRHNLPVVPPQTTLILDGVCPYVGPAVVFESSWDLRGALRLMYRDSSLEADIATRKMVIEPLELTTELYGEVYHYPFRDGLLVYDKRRRTASSLRDPEAARRYFDARVFDAARDCPPGHEGLGASPW